MAVLRPRVKSTRPQPAPYGPASHSTASSHTTPKQSQPHLSPAEKDSPPGFSARSPGRKQQTSSSSRSQGLGNTMYGSCDVITGDETGGGEVASSGPEHYGVPSSGNSFSSPSYAPANAYDGPTPIFQIPNSSGKTLPPLQTDYQQYPAAQYHFPAGSASNTSNGDRPSLPGIGSLPGMSRIDPQQSHGRPTGWWSGEVQNQGEVQHRQADPSHRITQQQSTVDHAASQSGQQYYYSTAPSQLEAHVQPPHHDTAEQQDSLRSGQAHQILYVGQHNGYSGHPQRAVHTQFGSQAVFIDPATGRQIMIKREPNTGEVNDQPGHEQYSQNLPPMQLQPVNGSFQYRVAGSQQHAGMVQGGMILHPMQMQLGHQQVIIQQPHPGRLMQPPMPWLHKMQGRDEYGNSVDQAPPISSMRYDSRGIAIQEDMSQYRSEDAEQARNSRMDELSPLRDEAHATTSVHIAQERLEAGQHQVSQRTGTDRADYRSDAHVGTPGGTTPSTPALTAGNPNSISNSRSTATPSPSRRTTNQAAGTYGGEAKYSIPMYAPQQGQTIFVKPEPQDDASRSYQMAYAHNDQLDVGGQPRMSPHVQDGRLGRTIYTEQMQSQVMTYPGMSETYGPEGLHYIPLGSVLPPTGAQGAGANNMQWRLHRSLATGPAVSSRGDSPASSHFTSSASYLSPGFGNAIHSECSRSAQGGSYPAGTISPSSMYEIGAQLRHLPEQQAMGQGYHKSGLLRAMNLSDDTVSSSEGDRGASQPLSPPNPIGTCFTSSNNRRITLPPINMSAMLEHGTLRQAQEASRVNSAATESQSKRKQTAQLSALRTTSMEEGEETASSSGSEDEEDEDDGQDEDQDAAYDEQYLPSSTREGSPKKRRKLAPVKANAIKLPNPVPDKTVVKRPRGRIVATDPAQVNSNVVHVCPIAQCGACFKRREHVKRHIRGLHTHEKPWPCKFTSTCSKSFSRGDNLKAHYLAVHKVPATEVDAEISARESGRPAIALRKHR